MKSFFFAVFIFLIHNVHSQVAGTVKDSLTGKPLQYVSVWIKNKTLGATTNEAGKFVIDKAKPGDTIVASFLGFSSKELLAEDGISILMEEKADELKEVVVIPMKAEREREINSYKNKRQIKEQLFAGEQLQYAAARFIAYNPEYENITFLKGISFVAMNNLGKDVPILVSVIKANSNGSPSDRYLLKNRVVHMKEGREEMNIDLTAEKLQIPKEGFFVVLERVYQEGNRRNNKNYVEGKSIKYIYEPSLGLVNDGRAENLWWSFGGKWYSPVELQKKFPFEKKDLAINVQLTN